MSYLLPYDFVIRALYPVRPKVKKLLGGYGLYLNKKLILFLRDRVDINPEFNGVFVATVPEFFKELQQEIHTSRMEFDFDGSKDSWIFISEDLSDFEQKVTLACELIKKGDERIGK
jgi:hypothetical protein